MPGIQIEVEEGFFPIGQNVGDNGTLECAWQGTGAALITHERARQKEVEGYDEGDEEYIGGELLSAAHAYIFLAEGDTADNMQYWPWPPEFFRPNDDPIRALTKAGALIAAEIDRLLALENGAQDGQADSPSGLEF